jgi:hypothetical protein
MSKEAILRGCYNHTVDWDEFPYYWANYYFFPRDLLSEEAIERWSEGDEHCLSSHHFLHDKKECVRYVWRWAKERGIKVTQAEIARAFTENAVG